MRTRIFLKHLFMGALLVTTGKVVGQSTTPGNVAGGVNDFLGWDNTFPANNFPLQVRHDLNQPIQFHTAGALRLRLMPNMLLQTVNGYPNLNLSGFLGLGQFIGGPLARPFTMLHLDNGAFNDAGYRPWMRTGTTLTQDSDLAYFGFKNEGADINHTVVTWSDNTPGVDGPDLLKFIFNRNNVGGTTAAGLNGLEAGRFFPSVTGNEVFFGLGDWFTAGLNGNPTERLDLLNGRLRLRQLPNDQPRPDLTRVLVVDPAPGNEFGVVKWRDITSLPDNCEWTMNASAPNHVYTAVGAANPNCPDEVENVGIGTASPAHKLDVLRTATAGDERGLNVLTYTNSAFSGPGATIASIASSCTNQPGQTSSPNHVGVLGLGSNGTLANYGFHGRATTTTGSAAPQYWNTGVRGEANGVNVAVCHGVYGYSYGQATNYGVYGWSNTGTTTYGLYGKANSTGVNYGSRAEASGPAGSTNYGLYASAPVVTGSYAGCFQGDIYCNGTPFTPSGGMWSASDASLKTNQAPVVNATASLALLQPKTYDFLTAQYPTINLPTGQQAGFYAQELEQVFPQLVKDVTIPAQFDSTGVQVSPAYDVKSINYTGLVPYLVAALQEQNTRIDQLQQQLNQCCNAGGGIGTPRSMDADPASNGLARETDLRIIPNPVAASTQLRYTVATEGRVRLEVSDAMGRLIEVLEEGQRTAGEFTFQWNTSGLAPGTYYCTLLVNDEPLVKRAVKLNER